MCILHGPSTFLVLIFRNTDQEGRVRSRLRLTGGVVIRALRHRERSVSLTQFLHGSLRSISVTVYELILSLREDLLRFSRTTAATLLRVRLRGSTHICRLTGRTFDGGQVVACSGSG